MLLIDLFKEENIDLNFEASSKSDALAKLSILVSKGRDFLNSEEVLNVLLEREKLGSTGIGSEVAIPHGKIDSSEGVFGAFAVSHSGVEFDSIDKKNVKIFFTIIASKNSTNIHLKILAKISRLLMDETLREEIKNLKTYEDFKKILLTQN